MAGGFRYTDAQGVDHLVEDLGEVPPAFQKQARPLGREVERAPVTVSVDGPPPLPLGEWLLGIHLPSAVGGAALMVMVAGVFLLRRAGHGKAVRLLLTATIVVGLFLGYVAWTRDSTGLSANRAAMPTPAAVVQDAQQATQALDRRLQEQQKALEQLAPEESR